MYVFLWFTHPHNTLKYTCVDLKKRFTLIWWPVGVKCGSHCHPEGVNSSLMLFAPPWLYFPLWQETPPSAQTAFQWSGPSERATVYVWAQRAASAASPDVRHRHVWIDRQRERKKECVLGAQAPLSVLCSHFISQCMRSLHLWIRDSSFPHQDNLDRNDGSLEKVRNYILQYC